MREHLTTAEAAIMPSTWASPRNCWHWLAGYSLKPSTRLASISWWSVSGVTSGRIYLCNWRPNSLSCSNLSWTVICWPRIQKWSLRSFWELLRLATPSSQWSKSMRPWSLRALAVLQSRCSPRLSSAISVRTLSTLTTKSASFKSSGWSGRQPTESGRFPKTTPHLHFSWRN